MSDSSTMSHTGRDEPLERILLELEQQGFTPAAVEQAARSHPEHAAELRELAGIRQNLQSAGGELFDEPSIPERLGDFRIVRQIAAGGMGEIYEAVQVPLNRRVAIKTVRRGRISPEVQERFLNEQRALARLHQTNIVTIFTCGQEGALSYFAMPYIDGASLQNVVETVRGFTTSPAARNTPSLGRLAELACGVPEPAGGTEMTHLLSPPVGRGLPRTGDLTGPVLLSPQYFRSIAEVMASVAEALEHAHAAGIFHRDIKPANIMIDTAERCWIIDFGLARFVERGTRRDTGGNGEAVSSGDSSQSRTTAAGTPRYMAPEQFEGVVDSRTDVWGLGVTLYELITLRPAFPGDAALDVRDRVRLQTPVPASELARNVPRDLAAIFAKATRKDADARYQSAREFAEDLRRWLRGEPTLAAPVRTPRRVWKWALRNKGWASAIAVALVASVALSIGSFRHQQVRAQEAESREREGRRHLLLQEMQRLRLTERSSGWSRRAWELAREAAEIRRDDRLRDEAAAGLIGLDASVSHFRTDFAATDLAFDGSGQRLVIGGGPGSPSRVWSPGREEPRATRHAETGPVAFVEGRIPVQLVLADDEAGRALVLLNLDTGMTEERFTGVPLQSSRPEALALAADAGLVAAAIHENDATGAVVRRTLLVWKRGAETPLLEIETSGTALAFSPDGTLLAAGDENGDITVWSIPEGRLLQRLQDGRTRVHCLCFAEDRRQHPAAAAGGTPPGWLLAAGGAGGRLTIWSLRHGTPLAFCRGSQFDVYAVSFCPDATLLASTGRESVRLWESGTGRLLLTLSPEGRGRNMLTGLAFSPDGRRLAAGSVPLFGYPGGVDVWELERGRGIQTLRGLTTQIAKVVYSPDGRLLAAVSHDWQVGLWDAESGRLIHVLDVPQGLVADNCALAFSPDGRQFAFATGTRAKLWSVEAGKELRGWTFPPGLADSMAFHSSGRLLLFRFETREGRLPPYSNVSHATAPRVGRLRDLFAPEPISQPLAELGAFNIGAIDAVMAPDGSTFVVDGIGSDAEGMLTRTVAIYEGPTGRELWARPSLRRAAGTHLLYDASGRLLLVVLDETNTPLLHEAATGFVKPWAGGLPKGLSVGAEMWSVKNFQPREGMALFRGGDEEPVMVLGADLPVADMWGGFHPAGAKFAWGNADGGVQIATLDEVRLRLAEVQLGWQEKP